MPRQLGGPRLFALAPTEARELNDAILGLDTDTKRPYRLVGRVFALDLGSDRRIVDVLANGTDRIRGIGSMNNIDDADAGQREPGDQQGLT